ncbi:MAG: AAA family ATPase, partial [Ramlibacter sp.]|nr:AAA family ATPase [Ramlibacter sp.]
GTGKTTVCRLFLEQIPKDCNVAYIFNPKLTVIELLQSIGDEFHIDMPTQLGRPATVKDFLDPLNAFLLKEHAAGRNNVLIIDEAQNLEAEVLEQLRLLTNLETRERKLLQIVLIGQPELRAMLARPELEQLAQRVIARYHLGALTPDETAQYIEHRLDVAGLNRPMPFQRKALARIHELSRGVPRRINLLCDRALLGAFANNKPDVDRATVDKAAAEVFDKPAATATPGLARMTVVLALGLIVGAGLFAVLSRLTQEPVAAPVVAMTKPMAKAAAPLAPPVAAPPAVIPASAPVVAATAAASAASAPVAAVAAPTAPPVLHSQIDAAWRELAKGWNAQVGEGDPCRALVREQLQCFTRNVGLPMIRELGRPGIIKLDATSGSPSYALLTAVSRDTATLSAAGTEQTVTLAALAARWQGDFATLWRAPPGYTGLNIEARGATIDWIATKLAAIDKRAPPAGPRTLDNSLKTQLRAFQLSHGLEPDGQPGPMTFMQLNRAAGVDEPRLRTQQP